MHTCTTVWILFLLMGSKGTSFSWCGVIEAAILKGCVPLLLLRHKVLQTSSQLLTQEVRTVHCTLMKEVRTHFIYLFHLDVALLTEVKLSSLLVSPCKNLLRSNLSDGSIIINFFNYFIFSLILPVDKNRRIKLHCNFPLSVCHAFMHAVVNLASFLFYFWESK